MNLTLHYFASLRDQAGCASETLAVPAGASLVWLYDELQRRHGFALPRERLRVAIDDAFVDWASPLHEGAAVVFVPPVSGG